MRPLENQVALVTGAGRGIGRAIAQKLAQEGAEVVCLSRTKSNAEDTAKQIENAGGQARAVTVDVSDSEAVNEAIKAVVSETGRMDILVNNAGITRDGLLMRMSDQDWDDVMNTNVKGAVNLTRSLSRQFIKQRSGRIINISSVIGLVGNVGQSNYAASKAALIGFTKSVARELAPRKVTVNAVAPGFIETDMTAAISEDIRNEVRRRIPLNQFGEAEDIANAVVFLAGPGACYITGQVLTVDGGMVM